MSRLPSAKSNTYDFMACSTRRWTILFLAPLSLDERRSVRQGPRSCRGGRPPRPPDVQVVGPVVDGTFGPGRSWQWAGGLETSTAPTRRKDGEDSDGRPDRGRRGRLRRRAP